MESRSVGLMGRLLPGIACLIYPLLVSSISGVSPFLLPLTFLPLLASLACLLKVSPLYRYPRAVAVAHLGVGAPAMYSAMGGWLDFQKTYPFHGNSAWVVLWSVLVAVVAFERPVT